MAAPGSAEASAIRRMRRSWLKRGSRFDATIEGQFTLFLPPDARRVRSAFLNACGAPPLLALARRLRASLGPRALSTDRTAGVDDTARCDSGPALSRPG